MAVWIARCSRSRRMSDRTAMRRITLGSTPSSVIFNTARERLDMGRSLSDRGAPVPGQKFVDPARRVPADAADQIGEIGLGIDAIELAALDQREEDRRPLAAAVGAKEGPVATPERQ